MLRHMTIPRLRGEGFLESQLRQLSYFCLISGKLKLNIPTPIRSESLSNMLISDGIFGTRIQASY